MQNLVYLAKLHHYTIAAYTCDWKGTQESAYLRLRSSTTMWWRRCWISAVWSRWLATAGHFVVSEYIHPYCLIKGNATVATPKQHSSSCSVGYQVSTQKISKAEKLNGVFRVSAVLIAPPVYRRETGLCRDDPSPRLVFLRGVFLANHLASTDNQNNQKTDSRSSYGVWPSHGVLYDVVGIVPTFSVFLKTS